MDASIERQRVYVREQRVEEILAKPVLLPGVEVKPREDILLRRPKYPYSHLMDFRIWAFAVSHSSN